MIDADLIVRFILALGLVLVLIVVTGWVGRRYMGSVRLPSLGNRRRRLAVVETLPIDGRTRLYLVKRDATEHLVMLSAAGAVLVETGIPVAPDFARTVEAAAPALEAVK